MAPIKAKQPVSWLFLPYWIIANSVGLGLDFGLARIVALAIGAEVFMDTGAPSYGLVDGTFAWIIVGAVLGAAHWFVLHQYVRRAHWWALALILLLASLAAWGGHEDGRVTMPWIPGGVMYGAASALWWRDLESFGNGYRRSLHRFTSSVFPPLPVVCPPGCRITHRNGWQ